MGNDNIFYDGILLGLENSYDIFPVFCITPIYFLVNLDYKILGGYIIEEFEVNRINVNVYICV